MWSAAGTVSEAPAASRYGGPVSSAIRYLKSVLGGLLIFAVVAPPVGTLWIILGGTIVAAGGPWLETGVFRGASLAAVILSVLAAFFGVLQRFLRANGVAPSHMTRHLVLAGVMPSAVVLLAAWRLALDLGR